MTSFFSLGDKAVYADIAACSADTVLAEPDVFFEASEDVVDTRATATLLASFKVEAARVVGAIVLEIDRKIRQGALIEVLEGEGES